MSRRLVVGGLAALLIAAPNPVWQATNGWPQLDMARALSDRFAAENRATLLALQLLFLGPLLAPLLWWGVRWLRRHPAGQPFRSLLWAWPISLVATFATGTTPHDIANEVHGAPIVVCRGLQTTWERLWPLLRHLS